MTTNQFNRMKLANIMTFETYNWLSDWLKSRYPHYKYDLKPEKYFYSNTKNRFYLSKFLESVIIKVLKYYNADPVKAADAGKWIDTSHVVSDVVGNQKKIGSGNWIKAANVHPGRADIKCFFRGQMYNLEVKVGRDRMSDEQKAEQKRAEQNGEIYLIIKTVDDFLKILQ